MDPFYTELKKLREKQEIDLTEISNRTKINIRFLELIESGDYSFLPYIYCRLFLRAYAVEIGSDPDEALANLEEYLKQNDSLPEQPKNDFDDLLLEPEPEEPDIQDRTPFEVRSSVVKVAILLAILIFAIFIIKKITADRTPASSGSAYLEREEYIPTEVTDTDLSVNYSPQVQQNILNLDPPYQFSLRANKPIWYQIITDNVPAQSTIIMSGGNISYTFDSFFHIRVDRAANIEIEINNSLISFGTSPNPIELSYASETGELKITNYLPL